MEFSPDARRTRTATGTTSTEDAKTIPFEDTVGASYDLRDESGRTGAPSAATRERESPSEPEPQKPQPDSFAIDSVDASGLSSVDGSETPIEASTFETASGRTREASATTVSERELISSTRPREERTDAVALDTEKPNDESSVFSAPASSTETSPRPRDSAGRGETSVLPETDPDASSPSKPDPSSGADLDASTDLVGAEEAPKGTEDTLGAPSDPTASDASVDPASTTASTTDFGSGSTGTDASAANAGGFVSKAPFFGGGGDVGRSYAPRGFSGGVPREPECGSSRTSGATFAATVDTRQYIIRFKENVTETVYLETKRFVETDAIFFDGDDVSGSLSAPSLRAAAPRFRVAVLGGVTRTWKRRFQESRARDIESIEPDVEVKAFRRLRESEGNEKPKATARPSNSFSKRESDDEFVALRPRYSCASLAQLSLLPSQWNLDRVSVSHSNPSQLDGTFQSPECLCGRGVHVYVLDTGVLSTHSDFANRVGRGVNFVECDGDGTGNMKDDSGHGTHVSGTVLGTTSGLAKCATLHPVRILDGEGKGKSSSILEALDWIAEQDVSSYGPSARKVVCMSLGGPRSNAIDAAVKEMVDSGTPVIVAAGNEASDASSTSPAAEASAIAVGSTSCRGGSARCASDAVSPFSNYGEAVVVYAPGDGIRSAWRTGNDDFKQNSGTSMAAPFVAGAVALYLEKFPSATPAEIKDVLRKTVTKVAWTENDGSGPGGMLDLKAMLRVAPR
jgi:hypothetical protein